MSSVNNYVLKVSCSAMSERLINELNTLLRLQTDEPRNRFVAVEEYAGGTRAMECHISLLAGNYVTSDVVVGCLAGAIARLPRGSTLTIPNSIQLFCLPDADPGSKGMQQIFAGAARA